MKQVRPGWKLTGMIVALLAALLAAGCSTAVTPDSAPLLAGNRSVVALPETAGPAGEAPLVAEEAAPVDHCLDCHTDKQRLIDTAAPEEKVPSESSGVG